MDEARRAGEKPADALAALAKVSDNAEQLLNNTDIVSCVFAKKPGDGSAREQAASCQKVLGGGANICYEYATKRYRSNCINWGLVPFTIDKDTAFDYAAGDYVFIPGIREAIANKVERIPAKVISGDTVEDITLNLTGLTDNERTILMDGCLMNYYAAGHAE